MSEYDQVRISKLKLKGEKSNNTKCKKRKHKSKKHESEAPKVDEDTINHGNWWRIKKIEDIVGPVAIEFGRSTYVKALDNGLFTLGAPHNEGEGPSPEEILTGVAIDDRKVAFKSGYNKYLRIEKNGAVTARLDAIGAMEQWELVRENGKMALLGYNECFMSVDDEDTVIAKSKKAGPNEFIQIRSQTMKQTEEVVDVPEEERGSVKQIEINYVKKFQKFQDKRMRLCTEDPKSLEKARDEGTFHEALLDRRSKMKADRYCK